MRLAFLILLAASQAVLGQAFTLNDMAIWNQSVAVPNTLTNEIAAYWRLDEANNTRADASGNSKTLSLYDGNQINSTTGIITNAALLPGINSYGLERADEDGFSVLDYSVTFAGWVNFVNTNANQAVLSKTTGQNEYLMWWGKSPNTFQFIVYTNAATASCIASATTNNIVGGNWYFVVGQVDNTNKIAKIRYGSTSVLHGWQSSPVFNGFGYTGTGTNSTAPFHLGKYNTTPLNGSVDEFGFWHRLLTDSEITNLWNSGAGRTWPLQ